MANSIINNVQPFWLEHIKNVTHNKWRWWYSIHLSHGILKLREAWYSIIINQFEICAAKSK